MKRIIMAILLLIFILNIFVIMPSTKGWLQQFSLIKKSAPLSDEAFLYINPSFVTATYVGEIVSLYIK